MFKQYYSINNIIESNFDGKEIVGELHGIKKVLEQIVALKKAKAKQSISDDEFWEKLETYLDDNFDVGFHGGDVPFPQLPQGSSSSSEGSSATSDRITRIMSKIFWGENTDKGLKSVLKLQGLMLMCNYKLGMRTSAETTRAYVQRNAPIACTLAQTIPELVADYNVSDDSLVELLKWCEKVLRMASPNLGGTL